MVPPVSIILIMLLVVAGIVLAFTPGIGILAVVPLAVALLVGVWIAIVFFSARTTPGQAVRHTRKAELLGPGGPDDPDRHN
jgi:hypothetical protein